MSGAPNNFWWICYFLVAVFVCQYYLIYKAKLALTSEIEQVRIALNSAELNIQDMDKKASEPMQNIQELQQRIANLEKKSDEIQSNINNLQQKLDAMEKKANNATNLGALQFQQNAFNLDNIIIDHEKLDNFLSSKLSPDVKSFFTFSKHEASKMDALEGDTPQVVNHVRKYMIIPPPSAPVQYETNGSKYNEVGLRLQYIFQNKTGGYFVESGVNDGLHLSTTIMLESVLAWSGVLIEPDPGNLLLTRDKNRNVSLVPTCLSVSTKPKLSDFSAGQDISSKLASDGQTGSNIIAVHCMPIHSILLALNKTSIDFLSLSIGGLELDVLKTIPFEKIDIKSVLVNFEKVNGGKKAVEDFLSSKNYAIFPTNPAEQAKDKWAEFHQIFVKKGSNLKEA